MIKILLTLIIILVSCHKADSNKNILKSISFVEKLELNLSYLDKGIIAMPPRTWVKLLNYSDIKNRNERKCLVYKTPFKEDDGVLKVVIFNKGQCQNFSNGIEIEKNIRELALSHEFSGRLSKKKRIILKYIKNDKEQIIKIPLLNYKTSKRYKKYDNQLDDGYVEDVSFGPAPAIKYYERNLCYGVNSQCMDIVKNNCSSCKEGFYEVVDYNCPSGGSRYCGQIKCGTKNMPACPRGYAVLSSKLTSLCFDGSPAGLCQAGLRTFCSSENILICI